MRIKTPARKTIDDCGNKRRASGVKTAGFHQKKCAECNRNRAFANDDFDNGVTFCRHVCTTNT